MLKTRSLLDVAVLDPANRISVTDGDVMRALFAGLVRMKPGDTWGWEKDLAVAIEQVDPTHITFTLRPGVPWTNGFGEVSAEDVKFSYERIADPAFKAAYRTDWDLLDHVEVTGPLSGVIVLKRPFVPLWSSTLPAASGLILCKKAVEAMGGNVLPSIPWRPAGPTASRNSTSGAASPWNAVRCGPAPSPPTTRCRTSRSSIPMPPNYQAGEIDFTQLPLSAVPRLRESPPAGSGCRVRSTRATPCGALGS